MDKTLSQAEVDALLQAVKSGSEENAAGRQALTPEESKVISYNFRRPHLISTDQMKGFKLVHEAFAKSLANSLASNLKTPIEIKLASVDNTAYGDVILSFLNPTFVSALSAAPNPGELVFEMNLRILLSLMDILLGGSGIHAQEDRELTAVEKSVAASVVDYVLVELHSSWAGVADMNFKLQTIESNPEIVQIAPRESLTLTATFDLRIGDATGTATLCYPFDVVRPALARLSVRASGRKEKPPPTDQKKQQIMKAIGEVPLTIRAELGYGVILASQVGRMKPGDVLCLESRIDSPAEVFIGDRACFKGMLCSSRGKAAVRIIQHGAGSGNGNPVAESVAKKK